MTRTKYVPAKIVKTKDGLYVDIVDRPVRIYRKKKKKADCREMEETTVVAQGRMVGRKTYITTCYFEPKHVPVKYSETMIFNIGSKKKRFFESIYNEMKLYPFHWKESVILELQEDVPVMKAESVIPLEFEYIPIVPPV